MLHKKVQGLGNPMNETLYSLLTLVFYEVLELGRKMSLGNYLTYFHSYFLGKGELDGMLSISST